MTVKLLTELYLEFLSFNGGCRGSSESTLVKMQHCWKSHELAQLIKMTLIKRVRIDPVTGTLVLGLYSRYQTCN